MTARRRSHSAEDRGAHGAGTVHVEDALIHDDDGQIAQRVREAATGGRREKVRLTADLPARDAAILEAVAVETGFNKVTTLVRAIRVLAELVRAERDGGELTIRYPDGRRGERLLLR